MKLILILLICYFITTADVLCEKIRFDNYKVYSVNIEDVKQLEMIENLENNGYTFWNHPTIGPKSTDIMVPPHKTPEFIEILNQFNFNYKLKVDNVQKLIDNERPTIKPRVIDWTDYHTYDEIYEWLDELLAMYPDILTNYLVGTSYLGRPIRAVRLSFKPGNPAIFIESNIHAREWITSATATWFLNTLLTSTDPAIIDLKENIDWYIMPIFNVDGFIYTHEVNRMWRKTRQNHFTVCYGTDANRNFGYEWMGNNEGASQNPCSETYAGPYAFSEPETQALADFVSTIADNIRIYISFHSYSHLLLLPYGHTAEPSWNHDNMMLMGNRAAEAISVRYGTNYTVGTFHTALYPGTGLSIDYVFNEFNLPAAFLFEFRDDGEYGFILPADQIIENAVEITDGIIALIDEARILEIL